MVNPKHLFVFFAGGQPGNLEGRLNRRHPLVIGFLLCSPQNTFQLPVGLKVNGIVSQWSRFFNTDRILQLSGLSPTFTLASQWRRTSFKESYRPPGVRPSD